MNVNLSDKVCMSIPNIKKLHLLYEPQLYGYDDGFGEHMCNNLHRLNKLESLNLSLLLFTNSGECKHSHTEMNKKLTFPTSLKKLCLSYCQLEWEDLAVIGSLPQLQVLVLGSGSVHGRKWSPVDGQFQHLKFLKIRNNGLVHWDADPSHFPVLEKLVLSHMGKLEEIPEGFADIPTLQLIRVSAAISAVRIKDVQVDNGSDSLQIHFKAHFWDLDDFKKMVDSEGLSMSNVQLESK